MNNNSLANLKYHDIIYKYYNKNFRQILGIHGKHCQLRLHNLLEGLSYKLDDKAIFLDLGCGTGNVLKIGAKYFKKAFGLDISFNMLKVAKKSNGPLIQGDSYQLPFRDSSLDLITSVAVLHHIQDFEKYFKEIYRVLKPGGYFYSDYEPNFESLYLLNSIFVMKIAHSLLYFFIDLKDKLYLKNRKDEIQEWGSLAEFHIDKKGINFLALPPLLKHIGFREIKIIPHSDPIDIKRPKNGRFIFKLYEKVISLLTGEKDYNNLAKIFAIRLIK